MASNMSMVKPSYRKKDKYEYFDKKTYFTFGNGDPKTDYRKNKNVQIHIGQLKLLLSEMEMLIYYMDISKVNNVIYIGAAPGKHIYVLSKLFPEVKFYLYDQRDDWDERIKGEKNITIINHYFSDQDIEEWKNFSSPFALISDIRNLETSRYVTEEKLDERIDLIWSDMLLQQKWVEVLKPDTALLKFRLPYPRKDETTFTRKYLDGVLLRGIFSKKDSTESRLLIQGQAYRDWRIDNYEKITAYHNQYVRCKKKFNNPIDGTNNPIYEKRGLENDFDSTIFTIIVMDYLKKINKPITYKSVINIIDYILDNCYEEKDIDLILEKKLA
jgi:hypothetical protein